MTIVETLAISIRLLPFLSAQANYLQLDHQPLEPGRLPQPKRILQAEHRLQQIPLQSILDAPHLS